MVDIYEKGSRGQPIARHLDKTVAMKGNGLKLKKNSIEISIKKLFESLPGSNPKWCYNNQFSDCVLNCSEISFRLFQEDLADDDWLAETSIKISNIAKKEEEMWLKLDPHGKIRVKIDLNKPMGEDLKSTKKINFSNIF